MKKAMSGYGLVVVLMILIAFMFIMLSTNKKMFNLSKKSSDLIKDAYNSFFDNSVVSFLKENAYLKSNLYFAVLHVHDRTKPQSHDFKEIKLTKDIDKELNTLKLKPDFFFKDLLPEGCLMYDVYFRKRFIGYKKFYFNYEFLEDIYNLQQIPDEKELIKNCEAMKKIDPNIKCDKDSEKFTPHIRSDLRIIKKDLLCAKVLPMRSMWIKCDENILKNPIFVPAGDDVTFDYLCAKSSNGFEWIKCDTPNYTNGDFICICKEGDCGWEIKT